MRRRPGREAGRFEYTLAPGLICRSGKGMIGPSDVRKRTGRGHFMQAFRHLPVMACRIMEI
jgi:hypothetical protein